MTANFLLGSNGSKVSMMRVAAMLVVSSIMSIWVAHNVISMIFGGGFVSMGQNEMMLVALTLGAKAVQYYGESKSNGNSHVDPQPPTTDEIPRDKTQ